MSDPARRLRALLRRDLTSFVQKAFYTVAPARPYDHNWHIDTIAWHLERCLRGDIKRLIITVPAIPTGAPVLEHPDRRCRP